MEEPSQSHPTRCLVKTDLSDQTSPGEEGSEILIRHKWKFLSDRLRGFLAKTKIYKKYIDCIEVSGTYLLKCGQVKDGWHQSQEEYSTKNVTHVNT